MRFLDSSLLADAGARQAGAAGNARDRDSNARHRETLGDRQAGAAGNAWHPQRKMREAQVPGTATATPGTATMYRSAI